MMKNYQTTVWDMTKSGPVTHMPLDERLTLATFYDVVATDNVVISDHRSLGNEIGGFLDREQLNPVEAADLARLAGRMRWISDVESENSERIMEEGARLHLSPSDAGAGLKARVAEFCRSMHR